jgi:hypothetical protein
VFFHLGDANCVLVIGLGLDDRAKAHYSLGNARMQSILEEKYWSDQLDGNWDNVSMGLCVKLAPCLAYNQVLSINYK